MTIRHGASDRAFDAAVLIILCLFAVSIVLPFMNLVSISVSNEYAIMSNSVSIFPVGISFASYRTVLKNQMILHSFVNSVVVAGVGCVTSLLMTSLASYPLAFGDFAGKRLYNLIIMLTMWFSGGMVPSFLVMSRLKLLDSFAALILMGLLSAYNILILSNFFRSIPLSLIESARIDGSNDFRTLFTIVIPLSKASLATIGLWVFVGHWNDYMGPLIYLRTISKYTLQPLLREMVLTTRGSSLLEVLEGNASALPEQLKHAVIVVAMLPVFVAYPFIQKYFVTGIMLGSVKE